MHDCVIVGAGVIGLSLAYELSKSGLRVAVIDKGEIGREASWAGAGILPPAGREKALHPYDQLRALSHRLHSTWAAELLAETAIDNGYRRCGGVYVAQRRGEAACLRGVAAAWQDEGIRVRRLQLSELIAIEPSVARPMECERIRAAYYLPDESQLRNPRHLRALAAACSNRGVVIRSGVETHGLETRAGRIETLRTSAGPWPAQAFCLASGAWTGQLLRRCGLSSGIMPVRGQMVLFRGPAGAVRRIINEGPRYIVPRDDGRVLAGSTEEEVGFDNGTTDVAIEELKQWACSLVPGLKLAHVERTWAGLRPGSFDGFPYLGKIPDIDNGFVAAGHFRSGLFLSPATAVVMSQIIRGEKPLVDLFPFRIGRG